MSQQYGHVPTPNDAHFDRGYGNGNSGVSDFATGNPSATLTSPLGQSMGQQSFAGQFHEDFDASRPNSAVDPQHAAAINRSASSASTAVAYGQQGIPSRNNTLKKKSSMRRATGATGSIKRSSSRRSVAAGSIRSVAGGNETEDFHSAFHTPVPTQGSPTDVLANRFQSWRQLLKSLIAYFREIQSSYEARAKAVSKIQSAMGGISHPAVMMSHNGLAEATRILEDFHRHSLSEANKSREIETDVIAGLSGLRSDLSQKIKEIKSLSGDFKNSVDKEKEATRREVEKLQDALQHIDHEGSNSTGKNDPFVVRLGVDRAVERQIDEENYLHRAYLNLETSGRELESIVVGEIQKAYNALAGILKREGDDAYKAVESLRSGPISMPKDEEWSAFVSHDPHFVAPDVPLRRIEDITYPGRDHPAACEIRAGMLERKSKYLKSYSPGWYVLSPTHLHEFKSADKIYTQPPVMSLYLADQKLGTHSEPGSSSSKFMLKGRQAGGVHKGHSWVFRAESHETMLAWYQDIQILTEKTGEERSAFVRRHARSVSNNSDRRRSYSSDGLEEDEADRVPYSADAASLSEQNPIEAKPLRPQPGGRFPSDLNIPRTFGAARTASSDDSSDDRDTINAGAVAVPAPLTSRHAEYSRGSENPYSLKGIACDSPAVASPVSPGPVSPASYDEDQARYMSNPAPHQAQQTAPVDLSMFLPEQQDLAQQTASTHQQPSSVSQPPTSAYQQQPAPTYQQPASTYHQQPAPTYQQPASTSQQPASINSSENQHADWIAPAAAGVGAGVAGTAAYNHYNQNREPETQQVQQPTTASTNVASNTAPINASSSTFPTSSTETTPFVAPVAAPPRHPTSSPFNSIDTALETTPPGTGLPGSVDNPRLATAHAANGGTYLSYPAETGAGLAGSSATPVTGPSGSSTSPVTGGVDGNSVLGGHEAKGAHETGRFPKVVRHDTDISVSQLHVPGEFPDRSPIV